MTTRAGSHVIVKMYTQNNTTAAKVPNVEIWGTSDVAVSTKALAVVKDVTVIAFIARDQLHCNRASIDQLILGCARDCFQASQNTKTSSAPMPRMM